MHTENLTNPRFVQFNACWPIPFLHIVVGSKVIPYMRKTLKNSEKNFTITENAISFLFFNIFFIKISQRLYLILKRTNLGSLLLGYRIYFMCLLPAIHQLKTKCDMWMTTDMTHLSVLYRNITGKYSASYFKYLTPGI